MYQHTVDAARKEDRELGGEGRQRGLGLEGETTGPSCFPGQCRPGGDVVPPWDRSTKREEDTSRPALVRGWRCCCRSLPQFHCGPLRSPSWAAGSTHTAKSTGLRVLPLGLPAAGTGPTREDEGSNCASSQDVGEGIEGENGTS